MFNAPTIFSNIPDIAQIYDINDDQSDELDEAIDQLDSDIFLDTMGETKIKRWEKMLGITPLDDDTLDDRRFRIKAKVLEKLPYSYRVIVKKLDTLCPDGYTLTISTDRTECTVKLAIKSKKMINDVDDLIDRVLPLNMTYSASILWNQYSTVGNYKHIELSTRTHQAIREEVFE